MYIIYGENEHLISLEIKKICGVNKTLKFDLANSYQELFNELMNTSLFSERILIIVNHPILYEKESKLTSHFIEIIQNSLAREIIFQIPLKELPNTPIINFLSKNTQIINCKLYEYNNYHDIIRKIATNNGGTITNLACKILTENLAPNFVLIENEIQRMLLTNHHIDDAVVNENINEIVQDKSFAFLNALINMQPINILSTYRDRIKIGDSPALLIGQLSYAFRNLFRINELKDRKMSNYEIINYLKIPPFQYEKLLRICENTDLKRIENLFNKLVDLETQIKIQKINPTIALDYWILKYIQNFEY